MDRPGEQEKKKSLLDKRPKLSRASQLMLIIGVFAILFIPTGIIYSQQLGRQTELKNELANLQTILSAPTTEKERLKAQLEQAMAETDAAREAFPGLEQSIEIVAGLLETAESNDIVITDTTISVQDEVTSETEFPMLVFEIGLEGQVPKFQNYILDMEDRFKTTEIRTLYFNIADTEGDEDIATLGIEIYCHKGN